MPVCVKSQRGIYFYLSRLSIQKSLYCMIERCTEVFALTSSRPLGQP